MAAITKQPNPVHQNLSLKSASGAITHWVWKKGAETMKAAASLFASKPRKQMDPLEDRRFYFGCLLSSPYYDLSTNTAPFSLPPNLKVLNARPAGNPAPPAHYLDPSSRPRIVKQAIHALYDKVATCRPHRYLGRKDYFFTFDENDHSFSAQSLIQQEIADRQAAGSLSGPLKLLDLGTGSGMFLLGAEMQNPGLIEGYGITARDDGHMLQDQIRDDYHSQIIARYEQEFPGRIPDETLQSCIGIDNEAHIARRAEVYRDICQDRDSQSILQDTIPWKQTSISKERYIVGNVEKLSEIPVIRPNSFDIITSSYLFQHLADPLGTLVQAYRSLKPGGLMIVHGIPLRGLKPECFKEMLEQQGIPSLILTSIPITFDLDTVILRKTTPDLKLPISYWASWCTGQITLRQIKDYKSVDSHSHDPKKIISYGSPSWVGEIHNFCRDIFKDFKDIFKCKPRVSVRRL